MESLVTVVVPVYNVEKYLKECIQSILNQDYRNLEIILVDDGSSDNSGIMCDQIAKTDNRVFVIHQENQGLSGARNSAIDIAKGQYITFVDSDDTIAFDMISSLVPLLQNNKAQMAVTGLQIFWEDGTISSNKHGDKIFVYSKEEALDCFLFNDFLTPCVCGKLYNLSLWKSVRCPLGKLHEDQYTTYKLIDLCDKIVFDSKPKYNYRKRMGSIGHSEFSNKTYDLYEGINEEYDYIYNKYRDKCPNIPVGKITWELVFVNMMIRGNQRDRKLVKRTQKFARINITRVLKCPYINLIRKIQIILFVLNFNLYRMIYLKYRESHPMA